jgi:hypothetical protein
MEMKGLFVIARELDQNDYLDKLLMKKKNTCFSQNTHFFSLKSIKIHYETIFYAKSIPKKNV